MKRRERENNEEKGTNKCSINREIEGNVESEIKGEVWKGKRQKRRKIGMLHESERELFK